MGALIAFLTGLIVGGVAGMMVTAVLVAGRRGDDELHR